MMKDIAIKDKITLKALENAPFDGWGMGALCRAATECGQTAQMAEALFADGPRGASRHVAELFDRRMMAQLKNVDTAKMKVRERIALAVMTRLDLMAPYRAGLQVALTRPSVTCLWRSADKIWIWAGDTATDYNHYTKRGLLAGVMASTMLYWLQDSSPRYTATRDFLARRIENVLSIGRILGKKKAA
ncbi:MAG: COQ9 family protein [Alphaproteobacteria bacterium]|nr:COQ9 family protein [Alphaproteobacteria bacterium]